MFHAKDGLFFCPLPYGDVHLVKTTNGKSPEIDKSNVLFETILGRGTLASIMASACKRGYSSDTFYEAYEFLQARDNVKAEAKTEAKDK